MARKKAPDLDYSQYFCHNEDCEDYGIRGKGNIGFAKHYGKDKERYLLKCKTCKKTFAETKGTPFFGLHNDPEKVVRALQLLVEGNGVRGTARILGVDKDTIGSWVKKAGEHCDILRNCLIKDLQMEQVQADEIWTFVQKRAKISQKKTIQRR